MRSFLTVLLVLGLSLVSLEQAAAETKIGFVNRTLILEKAPQAEEAKKALEKEFHPRDKKIVAEQKKLKKFQEQLGRDGPTMSDAQRRKLRTKMQKKQRSIKRATEEFREDFNIRRNEEIAKLQKKVIMAIKKLAKSGGYDLILIDGVGVLYHSKKIDITAKVLAQLRKL